MTEEISFLSEENVKSFTDKFENQQVFDEIVKLANNDKEVLKEINNKIAEHLDRIIMANLKIVFGEKEEELLNLRADLIQLKSGVEQIQLIDKELIKPIVFWQRVKSDLHKDLLKPLKKSLEEQT